MLWIMTLLFAAAAFLYGRELVGKQRLMGVIRTALRKAELNKRDRVQVPYNQMAELVGWKSDLFPMRDSDDFAQKEGPHPSRLSPARRGKLRR